MTSGLTRWVETLIGVALVTIVAIGTISLSPFVAQVLERVPWLTYMYTGGTSPQGLEQERVDPLPFETTGVGTAELLALGLPVVRDPVVNEVDRSTIFPAGHAITDEANETLILSARRALWTWDKGVPGLGVEALIVELPTARWASSLTSIWSLDPTPAGLYPPGSTQSQEFGLEEGQEFEGAKVQFAHNRLWVVVQVGIGPAYIDSVAAGAAPELDTLELARQLSLEIEDSLPRLDDLEGWDSLSLADARLDNAASLGVAATLTILARSLGGGFLDRGTREALVGLSRPRFPSTADDVSLTRAVRLTRLRFFARTFLVALASGVALIVTYFVSGAMTLVPMFFLVGALIISITLVATFARRRAVDETLGRRWLFAEAMAVGSSATVIAAGVFLVGTAGIGFTLGDGVVVRTVALVLLVLGLAVVGFAPFPPRLFKRLAMPAIKRALSLDERAPVLLLRSFQDDGLRVRIHPTSRTSPASRLALLNDSTFEDLIAWQAAKVAPVIAIGQPGTRLQPLGAVRDYFSDDDWQVAVLKRINVSSAVIFVVGRSPGAQWELTQIRERGALGKTLFIFPPLPSSEFRKRCLVLSAGLGLKPERISADFAWGTPLVAMRIGPGGELIRYFADGRDDIAYSMAVSHGLAHLKDTPAIRHAPLGAFDNAEDIARARKLFATYDPTLRREGSSDPFRRAVGIFLHIVE